MITHKLTLSRSIYFVNKSLSQDTFCANTLNTDSGVVTYFGIPIHGCSFVSQWNYHQAEVQISVAIQAPYDLCAILTHLKFPRMMNIEFFLILWWRHQHICLSEIIPIILIMILYKNTLSDRHTNIYSNSETLKFFKKKTEKKIISKMSFDFDDEKNSTIYIIK